MEESGVLDIDVHGRYFRAYRTDSGLKQRFFLYSSLAAPPPPTLILTTRTPLLLQLASLVAGWVWGWWGKIDYKKGLVHLAVCAGREKDGCLLELGKGIGEKDGWVSRMGREIDKGVGEVVELGGEQEVASEARPERLKTRHGFSFNLSSFFAPAGFEVFTNNGRRYISVNNFEVPLGYDCYVARRYLLAVATRGPWVHSALELGIEKYLEGDDGEAMFLWSTCAMMGATACAELAFEIMDGGNAEGGVGGGGGGGGGEVRC